MGRDLVTRLNNFYPDLGLVGKLLKEAHQSGATATRKVLSCGFVSNALAAEGLTGANTATHGVAPAFSGGTLEIALASTDAGYSQVSLNDHLPFLITEKPFMEIPVKFVRGGAVATNTYIGFGSAKNADAESMTEYAMFKIADSGTALTLSIMTDDATTDEEEATGISIENDTEYTFKIDASDQTNVKFYVNNQLCPVTTSMTLADYAGGFQPIFQIQKGAVTSTAKAVASYLRVESDRA